MKHNHFRVDLNDLFAKKEPMEPKETGNNAQECLEMQEIGRDTTGLPKEVSLMDCQLMQRRVLLKSQDTGCPLVYAASWWDAGSTSDFLTDASKPIWTNLKQGKVELYRDICTVYHGLCPGLDAEFKSPGPHWGRTYIFWNNSKPLTVIHEVFSSSLSQYLSR